MGDKNPQPTKGLFFSQLWFLVLFGIITMSFWTYENLQSKMAWYGTYHRTPINQMIHFFGVPGILWTAMLYAVHVPIPLVTTSMPQITSLPFIPNHSISCALVGILVYAISYLKLDFVGGLLYFPVLYLMYGSVVTLYLNDQQQALQDMNKKSDLQDSPYWSGTGRLLKYAFWIHILCWYIQIHPGHAIAEGAKPALLDSLGDSLTAAPLFAYHELIWFLGFRQELHQSTLGLVAQYTKQLCDAGSTMRVCATN